MSASAARERSSGLKVVGRERIFRLYSVCPAYRNCRFAGTMATTPRADKSLRKSLGAWNSLPARVNSPAKRRLSTQWNRSQNHRRTPNTTATFSALRVAQVELMLEPRQFRLRALHQGARGGRAHQVETAIGDGRDDHTQQENENSASHGYGLAW